MSRAVAAPVCQLLTGSLQPPSLMQLRNSISLTYSSCTVESKESEFKFHLSISDPLILSFTAEDYSFFITASPQTRGHKLHLHRLVQLLSKCSCWCRYGGGGGGACRRGTCDWNMWPRHRGRCERVPSGLCKCLRTVSISASGPASPYHLAVYRFQFCQRYHLASGSERRDGGTTPGRCQGFI